MRATSMKKLLCLVMMVCSLMQAHQPKTDRTHLRSSSMGEISPRRAAQAIGGNTILVGEKKPPKLGRLARHASLANVIGRESLESYDATGLPNQSLRKETVEKDDQVNDLGLSTMEPPAGYVNGGVGGRHRRNTTGVPAAMRGATPRTAFNPNKTVGSNPSMPSSRNPSKSLGSASERAGGSSLAASASIKPAAATVVAAATIANHPAIPAPANRLSNANKTGSKRQLLGANLSIVSTRALPTTDESATPGTPNTPTKVKLSVDPSKPPRSASGSSGASLSNGGSSPSSGVNGSGALTGRESTIVRASSLNPPSTPSQNGHSTARDPSRRNNSVTASAITVQVAAATHGEGGAQKTSGKMGREYTAASVVTDSKPAAPQDRWESFKARLKSFCCSCNCSCKQVDQK